MGHFHGEMRLQKAIPDHHRGILIVATALSADFILFRFVNGPN